MRKRGFLNPALIWRLAFWTISACLLVAVVASILAIWQFAGTDALWRTVATCAVMGGGTLTFSWVNGLFGVDDLVADDAGTQRVRRASQGTDQ